MGRFCNVVVCAQCSEKVDLGNSEVQKRPCINCGGKLSMKCYMDHSNKCKDCTAKAMVEKKAAERTAVKKKATKQKVFYVYLCYYSHKLIAAIVV
jgi:hypothetical protein